MWLLVHIHQSRFTVTGWIQVQVKYITILQDMGKIDHGPLTRYVQLRIAHASGMPGTLSPPSRVSDPDTHHRTCVTHVPWCMPGSLTRFPLKSVAGKRSRHSWRMRNPRFYVSGKRPIVKQQQNPNHKHIYWNILYSPRLYQGSNIWIHGYTQDSVSRRRLIESVYC